MKHFLTTVLALVIYSISYGQPIKSQDIDSLVMRSMKAFDVPGIAVAVIKDGKVIHSKGYGVRSLNSKLPVDENTLFGIASNSKAFTAAALGILVDEGKLNWDDKVRDYIPEFKLYIPYVTEEFTIKDLLTHRSGLGLGAGDLMFFPDGSDFTMKDIIYNLRFLKPVSSFRTKYDYDNNLYLVAGEIITRISGKSWPQFVEEKIFAPLGMKKSAGTYSRLADKSNVIDGHAPIEGTVKVINRNMGEIMAPAGGINSSIFDLSKWVTALLNGGKYGDNNSKHLFSNEVFNEMSSPQTIIEVSGPGPYNTHFASYGLGFFLSDVKGYKQLMHTGGLEGMVTQITMIPELQLGIIVLTNQQEGGAFASITNQIKDSYFGITGTDRVAEYAARRKKAMDDAKVLTDSIWKEIDNFQKNKKNKIDFAPYAGKYSDKWMGEFTISMKDSKMWLASKRSPKLEGELFYVRANTFVVKWTDRSMDADAFVTFSMDETGNAISIAMKPISPLTDFSYDFQDLDLRRTR